MANCEPEGLWEDFARKAPMHLDQYRPAQDGRGILEGRGK